MSESGAMEHLLDAGEVVLGGTSTLLLENVPFGFTSRSKADRGFANFEEWSTGQATLLR